MTTLLRNVGDARRAMTAQQGMVHEHTVGAADAPERRSMSNILSRVSGAP